MINKKRTLAILLGLFLTAVLVLATSASAQDLAEAPKSVLNQAEGQRPALPVDGKKAAKSQQGTSSEPLPVDGVTVMAEPLPDMMKMEAHQVTSPQLLSAAEGTIQVPAAPDVWTTITSENFEGAFPGPGWTVFDGDGATNGEYYWDDDSFKPYTGSWSGWPANGGADGYSPSVGYYPHNAWSWFVYGPFDLSDAVDAELLFYYWLDTELNYDYLGWYASTDGSNFHGIRTSGNSGGWTSYNFDLTTVPTLGDVTGQSNVWIAFIFTSDSTINTFAGPFLDDILLQKDAVATPSVNLSPYTPSGWDYPIVPSSVTGTNSVNDLYTYLDSYIDWAVASWGPDDIADTFYTCLYFDGSEIQCWFTNGLAAGNYAWVEDWVLNQTPTEGWHTLGIYADVYDDVVETDENDNYWEADFYWNGPAGDQPNLIPYQRSGWDFPIVPSSVPGTNTVNTLYHTQDTYIDWSVINDSTVVATGRFWTCLYLDGTQIECWYTDDLGAGWYVWVQDWIYNVSPPAGWHTVEIVTDVYNDIAESNENDNWWARDFYWEDPQGGGCAAAISEFEASLGGTKIPSTDNPPPEFMPPHPDLLERARRGEVKLPEFVNNPEMKRARGIDQPSVPALGPTGEWRALALLVEFTDNPATVGAMFFDSLLFGTSFGNLRHYFQDVSYGTLDIVTVNLPSSIGWCLLPQTYAYYVDGNNGLGVYPQNAQRMAEDAVLVADPLVDFSQYDNDGDGWVDTVFIIHAGPGAEFTGSPNDIWSHSWTMFNDPVVDGVIANGFTIEPEYWSTPGDMTSGVYAHELGHAFGLPDLYDTDNSSSGVGDWSLMGGGSWNGTNGDSPAWLDAWSRYQLGFSSFAYVVGNVSGVTIPATETSSAIYYLATDGITGPEYYMVENRQPIGYDAALPGDGLLIWHIDENISGNQSECDQLNNWSCAGHMLVALEQADGLWDLEHGSNDGDTGDPYPGSSNNRNYDFGTTPNSSSYYHNNDTCVGVNNISNSANPMTADLSVSCGGPVLEYDSHLIDDDDMGQSSGDDDGVADCGENIELFADLYNAGGADATGVNATISTSDPYATFTFNTNSSYPDIPVAGLSTNADDYDIAIDPNTPDGHVIVLALDITASNGGPWSDSFGVQVQCVAEPEPDIDIRPSALTSNQPPDWVNTMALDISNLGDTDLAWLIEESSVGGCVAGDISWASVAPDMGVTLPGNTTTVDVTFDSTGLSLGSYTGELCIKSDDPDESLVVIPLTLNVGQAAHMWIEPPLSEVGVNQTVTVDVMVRDITNMYGAALEIHFDPAIVQVEDADGGMTDVQITPGTCPSPDFVLQNEADNVNGIISYDASSLSPSPPCDGTGVVASITFRGATGGLTTPILFASWLLADTGGTPIPVTITDGAVEVTNTGAFWGTVSCQGRSDHSGAEVCAWSGGVSVACTLTDSAGYYELLVPGGTYDITADMELYLDGERTGESVAPSGSVNLPTVTVLGGDTNDDCIVNILDLAFMGARYLTSCGDTSWNYQADINADCTVNILDFAMSGSNYGNTCPVPW